MSRHRVAFSGLYNPTISPQVSYAVRADPCLIMWPSALNKEREFSFLSLKDEMNPKRV